MLHECIYMGSCKFQLWIMLYEQQQGTAERLNISVSTQAVNRFNCGYTVKHRKPKCELNSSMSENFEIAYYQLQNINYSNTTVT